MRNDRNPEKAGQNKGPGSRIIIIFIKAEEMARADVRKNKFNKNHIKIKRNKFKCFSNVWGFGMW